VQDSGERDIGGLQKKNRKREKRKQGGMSNFQRENRTEDLTKMGGKADFNNTILGEGRGPAGRGQENEQEEGGVVGNQK